MGKARVSIVVPTYNRKLDVLDCLASIRRLEQPDCEVVVVDNKSGDGTVEAIVREFPEVVLIQNETNLGVTGGRNAGARRAEGEYIFFLDHDTVVDKNVLAPLIEEMECDERIGAAGPVVYYAGDPERIWAAGTKISLISGKVSFGFSSVTDDSSLPRVIDAQILPTAFMVRRSVLHEAGDFDDMFFAGYEDSDFCFRVKKAGYRVVCVPGSKVWHKHGVKQQALPDVVADRGYYIARNRILFMRKHAGAGNFIVFVSIFQPLIMLYYTYKAWQSRRWDFLFDFWRGSFAGIYEAVSR